MDEYAKTGRLTGAPGNLEGICDVRRKERSI
jgi:hypothetical protein